MKDVLIRLGIGVCRLAVSSFPSFFAVMSVEDLV